MTKGKHILIHVIFENMFEIVKHKVNNCCSVDMANPA